MVTSPFRGRVERGEGAKVEGSVHVLFQIRAVFRFDSAVVSEQCSGMTLDQGSVQVLKFYFERDLRERK